VIAHLVEANLAEGLLAAVTKALAIVEGSYAVAVISQNESDKIIVARSGGPPLVIGHRDDGLLISSDIAAIICYTRDIQVLEDNEIAEINLGGTRISSFSGLPIDRARVQITWQQDAAEKNGYAHFMLKEIHEQPDAVMNTIRAQSLPEGKGVEFPHAAYTQTREFASTNRILILACGSSWHAGLVGKHLIELLSGTPVDVEIASEYRYRHQIKSQGVLALGISQSGETADTLGALKVARDNGARILSLCNIFGSTMSRESDGVIFTDAGPEIGVASTKTFTSQLTALALFAMALGQAKKTLPDAAAKLLFEDLIQLPFLIQRVVDQNERLIELATLFVDRNNALYLGRGAFFPLAMEGALKLKEISYIHAEAYPAGELKHGAIALVERDLPVVAIATPGSLYSKLLAAIQEVRARDGMVIALASEEDRTIGAIAEHVFYVPQTSELLMPILVAVPLQLLAYHVAVLRGCDVDKPRNLAKSVTVE
jgi:glucosamine--fructose-6-phosphate aminotransferase (isomerizing)